MEVFMNILVFAKVVPKVSDCKIDRETNNLIRDGVKSIINPPDLAAIYTACELKKKHGGKVVVASMGPDFIKGELEVAYSMGADEIYIISSMAVRGSDTLATSYVLSTTAKHLVEFDLVLTGTQTLDGDTGQVGPQLAEKLGLNSLTYAESVEVKGDEVIAKRRINGGLQEESVKMPALVSTLRKNINPKKSEEMTKEVKILTEKDIDFDLDKMGMKGSRTVVGSVFAPPEVQKGLIIEKNSDEEKVEEIIKILKDNKRI